MDVRQLLAIDCGNASRDLVARPCLGDGERYLARPGVEAGALHDGGRPARLDVVAVRDGEGALGDHFGGDGGLVGASGVGKPPRVDREHGRLDGPGHANYDLDALGSGMVVVGRGIFAFERVLPGVADGERRVLPREALGELDVRQLLPVGCSNASRDLAARPCLGDSKRNLARPGVEAGTLHDGDGLASRDVVAVRDGEGVLGDHLGGDGGLMGLAGIGQPLGVDREHRRLDGPRHADLNFDARKTIVI